MTARLSPAERMPDLLTVEEAASRLHASVTVSAIRSAIRDGRLTATKRRIGSFRRTIRRGREPLWKKNNMEGK